MKERRLDKRVSKTGKKHPTTRKRITKHLQKYTILLIGEKTFNLMFFLGGRQETEN